MGAAKQVWVNLMTAPRDKVESCFMQQRDEIIARIIRFHGELESMNTNRFPNEPIKLDLDFSRQLQTYMNADNTTQVALYNKAFEFLRGIESDEF